MKRIISVMITAVLLASSSACGNHVTPPESASGPVSSAIEATSADSSTDGEPLPAIPDNAELAAVLRFMRDAEPDEVTVEWITSDDGAESKLRITSELLAVIADVLATEPYSGPNEFLGTSYPDVRINMSMPTPGLPDMRSGISFEINTLTDNPENGDFAGKMVVQYSAVLSDGGVMFSYPISAYERLADELQAFVNTAPVTLGGSYAPIDSGFLKEAGTGDFRTYEALQFDNTLILLWSDVNSGPIRNYAVEAVDAATGKSLYHFAFDVELPDSPHMEKTDAATYDYRISYEDRIEYRSSADKDLLKTVKPPNSVTQRIWDSSDFYRPPFDIDTESGLLAYSGADGIYLCGIDGGDNRRILSNSDIPAIIAGKETPEHDDSQLKYALPLIMNGGKQLVASIYLMTNGNYDTMPAGVTVVDLATGETQSRADIAWLSSVQRLTPKTVGYIGGGDVDVGSPGFIIWNVDTKQPSFADFNWLEAYSCDYSTFVQTDTGRTGNGETLYTLYSYTLENPDNKKTLLTALNGWLRLCGVTENYAVCFYDDGLRYSQSRGNVIVPYN